MILMNYQKDYSSLYGIDLWQHEYEDGSSLEDYVKDLTASQLAEVYTLDIIAEEQELTLSEGRDGADRGRSERICGRAVGSGAGISGRRRG